MSIEQIRMCAEIAGYAAGVASAIFIAIQFGKERKLEEFKLLQSLEEKFTSLLWKGSEQSGLDLVWRKFPDNRKKELDSLSEKCEQGSWQIWNTMTEEERNCYRFTRSGLEILEQAYLARKRGWIGDKEIRDKWDGWTASWKKTNFYIPYVLAEMEHWFTPSFIKHLASVE